MTAGEALQSAVNLLAQARQASDSGQNGWALSLATESLAWAQVALAIEAGAPAPAVPDSQPAGFPAIG